MTRLRAILLALKLSAPHWGPQLETARELEALEQRWHVRAELVIADVEHESRWQERAVNPSSGALGLMQIMPLHDDEVTQSELRSWRLNLRRGVAVFALARQLCSKWGYGELARDWLFMPTGWDSVNGSRCGHRHGRRLPTPEGISWLIRRMHELEAASASHVGR